MAAGEADSEQATAPIFVNVQDWDFKPLMLPRRARTPEDTGFGLCFAVGGHAAEQENVVGGSGWSVEQKAS